MALTTLGTIIGLIQTTLKTVEGLRTVPDYPPEKATAFPFVVVFPQEGEFKPTARQFTTGLHQIVIEIHWALHDLPRDVERALPFLERTIKALWDDPEFSGGIDSGSINGAIRYRFGPLTYFNHTTIGWQIEVPVKSQGVTS